MGIWLLLALIITVAVFVALNQVGLPLTGVDDAHIFFVYGQNLAAGEGFVYNPAGEAVEGFSSLLWLLIVTLGFLIFPRPAYFLLVVSLGIISAAITVLVLNVDKKKVIGFSGLIVLAWILSSPAYITWMSLTLMDTVLWSGLLLLGVVFALNGRPVALAVVITAMLLARPEAMLWAPALIAIAALPTWTEKGPRAALRRLRPAIAAYLVTLIALTWWRWWTFGYPLPNTYYAKMSPDIIYNLGQGAYYLIAFILWNPLVLVGVVPAITALLFKGPWLGAALLRPGKIEGDDPNLRYIAVSLIVLLALLVPVYMGGDHFGNFRFYQPAWPLFLLPALALLDVLKLEMPRPVNGILVLAFILAAFLLPQSNWFNQAYRGDLAIEINVARKGKAIGRSLNTLFGDEHPSAGVIAAGGIAAVYEGEIIDLVGLNNPAMAHAPGNRKGYKNHAAFNADVFFSQRPQIVLPRIVTNEVDLTGIQQGFAWNNWLLKGLFTDPRFTASYTLITISDGQMVILAFADNAMLPQFKARGLDVALVEDG